MHVFYTLGIKEKIKMKYWDIIHEFSRKNVIIFSFGELQKAFPDTGRTSLHKHLSALIEKKMLIRLSYGIYHIVPPDQEAQSFRPNWRLLAANLSGDNNYYIAYASAMEMHALTPHPEPHKYICIGNQKRTASLTIADTTYKFIYQNAQHFFGYEERWINSHTTVRVSDLEKTLVDVMAKPKLGGGIKTAAYAMYISRKRVNSDKLNFYFARYGSKLAIKRYLFLTEWFGMKLSNSQEKLLKKVGSSLSPLDPAEWPRGQGVRKFGLIINTNMDELTEYATRKF